MSKYTEPDWHSDPDVTQVSEGEQWEYYNTYSTKALDGPLLADLQQFTNTYKQLYITSEYNSWGTCSWCGGDDSKIVISTEVPVEEDNCVVDYGVLTAFDSFTDMVKALEGLH